MESVEVGQVWEMYSSAEGQWVRVVVTKIEGDKAVLRHEGVLEFITTEVSDLQNKPDLFRPVEVGSME